MYVLPSPSGFGLTAVQTPAPVIMPGFRKKPLHKSMQRIPHSSCLTQLLSCEKTQTIRNQTYLPPKLWQETSTLGCVSMEMEGLQLLSLALNGGLAGMLGTFSWRGFLYKTELWEPIPCPCCSCQCKLLAPFKQRSGAPLSYPPLPTAQADVVQRKLFTYEMLTKIMSRKQVNKNSQTIAD